MDSQTIITILTLLGSAGAWQFYQSRMRLKHQERREDKGEQTLFRDDLRERVAILEDKLEQAYKEKNEVSERLAIVMTELAEYKVRLEFLEKDFTCVVGVSTICLFTDANQDPIKRAQSVRTSRCHTTSRTAVVFESQPLFH